MDFHRVGGSGLAHRTHRIWANPSQERSRSRQRSSPMSVALGVGGASCRRGYAGGPDCARDPDTSAETLVVAAEHLNMICPGGPLDPLDPVKTFGFDEFRGSGGPRDSSYSYVRWRQTWTRVYDPAVFKDSFCFSLGPPLPRGVPGEGLDCHLPSETWVFGRIRGWGILILIFILT